METTPDHQRCEASPMTTTQARALIARFRKLGNIDRRLFVELEDLALALSKSPDNQTEKAYHQFLKPVVVRLIGHERHIGPDELRTCEAYWTAGEHAFLLLTDASYRLALRR